MSTVFDNTGFGKRSDPYWFAQDWTDEQKRVLGDPKNRVGHMRRTEARIDLDKAGEPDAVFGPEI